MKKQVSLAKIIRTTILYLFVTTLTVAILLPVVSTFVQDQFGGATIDLLSTLLPPLAPGSPESALVEVLTLLAEQIVGGL